MIERTVRVEQAISLFHTRSMSQMIVTVVFDICLNKKSTPKNTAWADRQGSELKKFGLLAISEMVMRHGRGTKCQNQSRDRKGAVPTSAKIPNQRSKTKNRSRSKIHPSAKGDR